MYALVRENTYDPANLPSGHGQLDEFQALHARLPGYRGTIVVDAGNGRWLSVNLWESEDHATAALPVMVPEVQRILGPLMVAPSQMIGAGTVVLTDLRLDSAGDARGSRSGQ